MYNLNQSLKANLSLNSLSIQDLIVLYDQTVDELQHCARIIPDGNIDDEKADIHEQALLEFETSILNQAAVAQISSKDDVLSLMDMWSKIAEISANDIVSMPDRIAMNIFRHLNGTHFSKD